MRRSHTDPWTGREVERFTHHGLEVVRWARWQAMGTVVAEPGYLSVGITWATSRPKPRPGLEVVHDNLLVCTGRRTFRDGTEGQCARLISPSVAAVRNVYRRRQHFDVARFYGGDPQATLARLVQVLGNLSKAWDLDQLESLLELVGVAEGYEGERVVAHLTCGHELPTYTKWSR